MEAGVGSSLLMATDSKAGCTAAYPNATPAATAAWRRDRENCTDAGSPARCAARAAPSAWMKSNESAAAVA